MTKNEKALLLTVGRLLRAHLADHMISVDDAHSQDWRDLNESLAPFDPEGHGGDFKSHEQSELCQSFERLRASLPAHPGSKRRGDTA
jgi:hypothetical protein